jgi:hypothetical protein
MESQISIKDLDSIAYKLHLANYNDEVYRDVIERIGMDHIISSQHNGIVSKILEYYIEKKDDEMLRKITIECNDFLMKRDYLHIIQYIDSKEMIQNMFNNIVLQRFTLLDKDIDYIIKCQLYYLLYCLDGMFLYTSLQCNKTIDTNMMKLYSMPMQKIQYIMSEIEKKIKPPKFKNIDQYKAVIDGGSVIHARGGKVTKHSIMDLINIINLTRQQIGEPILIIHKRHLKTIDRMVEILQENNVTYHLTPPHINDDMYIIHTFLTLQSCGIHSYIVTNDKYRDHIYSYEKLIGGGFGACQFKNIVEQQIISYNVINGTLAKVSRFSRCIQIIDKKVMVPTLDGGFVEFLLR